MSHLMGPKQREMDDIIKRVFQYLEHQDAADGQNSLLVLVGDHGMTEVRSSSHRKEPMVYLN